MKQRNSLRIALIGFLLLMAITSAIGVKFYNSMVDVRQGQELARFEHYLEVGAAQMLVEIQAVRRRSLYLARSGYTAELLRARALRGVDPESASREAEWLERLTSHARTVTYLNDVILQIRLIGVGDRGREIMRVDRIDEMIVATPRSRLLSQENQPFYKAAMQLGEGEIYQSGIDFSAENQLVPYHRQLVMTIATPVYNEAGRISGVIVFKLDGQTLFDIARRVIPRDVRLYFTDQAGSVVLHPEARRLSPAVGRTRLWEDFPALAPGNATRRWDAHSGLLEARFGKDYLVYSERLNLDPTAETGLNVAALAIPYDIFAGDLNRIGLQVLLLGLCFCILASSLLYFASWRLARPMAALTERANAILAGTTIEDIEWPQQTEGDVGRLQDAFVSVITSVADRESEITEHIKRLATVTDGVTDAIIMIDEGGRMEMCNRAARVMFGYSEAELLGQNVKMLMPPYYRARHDGYLSDYVNFGKSRLIGHRRELTGQRKDGSTFAIELAISVTNRGGARRFIGIIRDISGRNMVDRMKSEFVSTVSHELRTPLSSIKGSLGLLLAGVGGRLEEEAAELVTTAYSNCGRLITLINDILDMERIESGKMRYIFDDVDLQDIVQTAVSEIRGMAAEFGVKLETSVPDAPALVRGDPDRLIQVLANLLSNAIKVSPPGERVLVSVSEVDGRWRVNVRDAGSGIPPEFSARIFERFQQVDNSTTRKIGGSGLGLSICKAIIREHRGKIDFTTGSGGTNFYFELEKSNRRPDAQATNSAKTKGRVLIFEENAETGRTLAELIGQIGYEAVVTDTAKSAGELLDGQWFDFLVVDWDNTQESSLEILQHLQGCKEKGDLPIIVISSADDADGLATDEASIIYQVRRPVEVAALRQILDETAVRSGGEALRVLCVEDDADQTKLLKSLLSDLAEIEVVGTIMEASQLIAENRYDVVVLDQYLPDGVGLSLLEQLKKRSPRPEVLLYSVDLPPSEVAQEISGSLVKSNVSNSEFLSKVKVLLRSSRRARKSRPPASGS